MATVPTPLILAPSALLTDHVRTDGLPTLTVEGAAEKVVITGWPATPDCGLEAGAEPPTFSTTVDLVVPFLLVAESV